MKKPLLLAFFFFLSATFFSQKLKTHSDAFFYENKGQIIDQNGNANPNVKYLLNVGGLNVQIKTDGFSYDVYEAKRTLKTDSKKFEKEPVKSTKKRPEYDIEQQFHRVDITFVGANKNPTIIAEGKSADYDNYYNLPHRPAGVENVHRFEKVIYKNLYSNIDLLFFKPADTLKPVEYNFIIHPGGKISDIKLQFKGAQTHLKDGKISMDLRFGEMQENIPHSWTEMNGKKEDLTVEYTDLGDATYGFKTTQDTFSKTVIIDPVPTRIWSTFNNHTTGGSVENFIKSTKNSEFVYESSQITNAKNLATSGAFIINTILGIEYGYVIKFGDNGIKIWGTFIGTSYPTTYNNNNRSKIWDGVIDENDNLYVAGSVWNKSTTSNPITTPGTFMQNGSANDREGFILKLNPSGQRIWGTYFGGSLPDEILCVDIDTNQNIIFGGKTQSINNISTFDAEIPSFSIVNNYVGFWGKMNQSGQLLYSTYFYAPVAQIKNDSSNNIYIGGQYRNNINIPKFTTPGVHQENLIGLENAFVIKYDHNYNKKWGTFYGGKNFKNGSIYGRLNDLIKIGTDTDFNVYIVGNTTAMDNISTPGSFKEVTLGSGCDIFIAKLNPSGQRIWGTYYGADTDYDDFINDAKINKDGDIYLTGRTWNYIAMIPPLDVPNARAGGFITKFRNDGTIDYAFLYNAYFSRSVSEIRKIDVNEDNIFISGIGDHPYYYATPGSYQQTGATAAFGGKFVAKFGICSSNPHVSANSQICPYSDINLSASGGTSYSWSGPNGFSSAQQNPTIPNATAIHTGTYTCIITGTGDCDGTYSVTVKVEDKTAPVPTLANLPLITGNCKTVISTIPTATDACMGNITATTSDPLHYSLPGNYVIIWKYDDGNGNISTQNQNVTITSEPLPIANAAQNFCKISSLKISDLQITGTSIKWYNAAGNPLSSNTVLTDGTKYFASQTLNGCESAKTEITVTLNDPTAPTGSTQQDFCSAQNPTISNLAVTGQNIIWYDSAGAMLTSSTPLSDGKTYYATQTVGGCESTQKLAVKVSVANGGIPANDYTTAFCNDTTATTKTVNLNEYKTNLIAYTAGLTFEFNDSANQLIANPANQKLNIGLNRFHVKIINTLGCFVYVKLDLTLDPKPALNLPASAEFCSGQSVDLDAGSGFSSYEWTKGGSGTPISSNQILNVTTAGTYNLKVKNSFGCENSTSVTVTQSSLGTITGVQIVNNTATVIMSNSGSFLYSLNNSVWQSSNTFSNLSNGNHTVYVKTSGDCVIGQMNFTIFNVPNSFTPNAEGINDTWKIHGMENYPNSDIKVYARNGKLVLSKMTAGTFEWDGKFDSRAVPTGSYWYIIKVSDGRLLNGWLLIKNRN